MKRDSITLNFLNGNNGSYDSSHPTMNNVESTMHKFSSSFRKAIEESVPIKKVDIKSPNQPIWFNKLAKKLVNRQRKLYNKFKSTSDPFHLGLYRKLKSNNKALKTLKKLVSEKVCKPLLKGNSKPLLQIPP